ncbi:unnamed protein product [Cochlearia groenlandica]
MPYLPNPHIVDIVQAVGRKGFRNLGPLIVSSKFFKDIVYSEKVLSVVDLQEFFEKPELANEGSNYRPFFLKCVLFKNNTARYIEGLRLLAQHGPSQQGIEMLCLSARDSLHSRLAAGIFVICCGKLDEGVMATIVFLLKVGDFEESINIANTVQHQIARMGTQTPGLFRNNCFFGSPRFYLQCGLNHATEPDICFHCFAWNYVMLFIGMC